MYGYTQKVSSGVDGDLDIVSSSYSLSSSDV